MLHCRLGGKTFTYDLDITPSFATKGKADHTHDIPYTIGIPLMWNSLKDANMMVAAANPEATFTQAEVTFSRNLVTYISNFVHSG